MGATSVRTCPAYIPDGKYEIHHKPVAKSG
jgi:hypothetical protein